MVNPTCVDCGSDLYRAEMRCRYCSIEWYNDERHAKPESQLRNNMAYSIELKPESSSEKPLRNFLTSQGVERANSVVATLHGPGVKMGHSTTDDFDDIRPNVFASPGLPPVTIQGAERRTEIGFSLPIGIKGPGTYRVRWRDRRTNTEFISALVYVDAPITAPVSDPLPDLVDPVLPLPDPDPAEDPDMAAVVAALDVIEESIARLQARAQILELIPEVLEDLIKRIKALEDAAGIEPESGVDPGVVGPPR